MPTAKLVVSTTQQLMPLVSELLFDAGAGGVEERPGKSATLVAYADDAEKLVAIWRKVALALEGALPPSRRPRAELSLDETEAWRHTWTRHLRPVRLTRKLWLSPIDAAPPTLTKGQTLLRYAPALAFGDGDHPTTRLAARAIEAHYAREAGGALLDIGAGTGVLSFVAVKSGARRAVGTDISEEAVQAARHNARLNELSKQTRFVSSRARVSGDFDLVVVNIELRPLLQVLGRLPAAARHAPRLLATGFLGSQAAEVARAIEATGFSPKSRRREGDWCLIHAVR